MEVKNGYKKTEVGVIPSDWEVKELGDIGDVKMCRRIFSYQTTVSGSIPFYKIGTFGKVADAYIPKDLYKDFKQKFSFPNEGDILISAAGTIGRTIIYNGEDAYFQDSNIVWIDNKQTIISNLYLYHILQVIKYNTEGGTIQRLYNSILKSTKFVCPTLHEQTAIATALSDTDAWINSLEQVLTKKRQIKQGAMQELLQPNPEASEGWEVKKLGDLITYKNGKSFESEIVENGNYLLITLNSINIKGKLKSEHLKVNSFDNSLEKGDLIMVLSDVAHGNFLGLTDIIPKNNKYVLNQRMGALKNLKGVTSEYLSYYINKNQKYFKMSGKGSSQQNLGKDDILNFAINLPKTKEEQTRIATILSDMDEEIAQLESKLEKAKQLKQGMMQELLTGRIRLV